MLHYATVSHELEIDLRDDLLRNVYLWVGADFKSGEQANIHKLLMTDIPIKFQRTKFIYTCKAFS
jgi:hypothetical protein